MHAVWQSAHRNNKGKPGKPGKSQKATAGKLERLEDLEDSALARVSQQVKVRYSILI